jgi:hypothetical protein
MTESSYSLRMGGQTGHRDISTSSLDKFVTDEQIQYGLEKKRIARDRSPAGRKASLMRWSRDLLPPDVDLD